ncbi:hypothetical protein [Exiguobacterium sp. s140]|uniref:hypothetical protein n=1 Tax=Exiguobacterium sp. s140 TaxID=2751290 RepID=UPI001BE88337|nr:hypothetical protein [Exiguobacterium sp. s140]
MKTYDEIKNRLSEERGSQFIEFTIALLLFVVFIAFTTDLLIIGGKRFGVNQEVTEVVRVLGKQGGVVKDTPDGYPGGDDMYMTSNELLTKIERKMVSTGLGTRDEGLWQVTLSEYDRSGNLVRTGRLTPETVFDVDYMNSMDVEIRASYQWMGMKLILGNMSPTSNVGAERHTVSEFKYDFDEWKSESYTKDAVEEEWEETEDDYVPDNVEDGSTAEEETGGELDAEEVEDITSGSEEL